MKKQEFYHVRDVGSSGIWRPNRTDLEADHTNSLLQKKIEISEMIEDLTDEAIFETHASGFIGLQVHGIGRAKGPYQVRWRNIRIRELASEPHS